MKGVGRISAPSTDSESVRIRKITNGYIVAREGTKRGKYFSHEEYSAEKPMISTAAPKPAKGKR